jgi:hypothetical protein
MNNKTIETLVWVLVYAGIALFGLGVWYVEHSVAAGASLMTAGAAAVAAGALLIWLRSRRP